MEVHLHGRSIGSFTHPYVEVFALARFKEENIVTVVEFGEFVELVKFGFSVEFRILAAMREKRVKVVEEVPMPVEIRSLSSWDMSGEEDDQKRRITGK